MTIKRTRELLGDRVKDMTDEEVKDLIVRFGLLAEVAIEKLEKNAKDK